MKKKGQNGLEYLMTYGWAIIIIIVVVGILFALGIFKTQNYYKNSQKEIEHKYICEIVCGQRGYSFRGDDSVNCDCIEKKCVEILNNVTGKTDRYCSGERIETYYRVD